MSKIASDESGAGHDFHQSRLSRFGLGIAVFFRIFMGVFFFLAGINKLRKGWLWSDMLKEVFLQRLTELDPQSFATTFLREFAIPLYIPTAYVVCLGEIAAGVSMILGLGSRFGGAIACFIIIMLAIGGYYDASLIPLFLMAFVVTVTPSGHRLGLDRRLHSNYPTAIWFK